MVCMTMAVLYEYGEGLFSFGSYLYRNKTELTSNLEICNLYKMALKSLKKASNFINHNIKHNY